MRDRRQIIQELVIPSGGKVSNFAEITSGFIFGLLFPEHNAENIYVRVSCNEDGSNSKLLMTPDGQDMFTILTNGQPLAASIPHIGPFGFLCIETDLIQIQQVKVLLVSKRWERLA